MSAFPAAESLRVLSIDGGGIKGYRALLILKRIFQTLKDEGNLAEEPRPCEVFDLIAGTSTGGLIAVMLGRLRMTIDECIKHYKTIARNAFSVRETAKGRLLRGKMNSPLCNIETLQREIKAVLGEGRQDEAFLENEIPRCKVMILVTLQDTSEPGVLRNFLSIETAQENDQCTIWEAASATCATPEYFKSVKSKISGAEWSDGGSQRSNPINEAIKETHKESIWSGKQIGCVLSLGVGTLSSMNHSWSVSNFARASVQMMTDSEVIERDFASSVEGEQLAANQYFRFSVRQGEQDFDFDEYIDVAELESETTDYMHNEGNRFEVKRCVKTLLYPDEYLPHRSSESKWNLQSHESYETDELREEIASIRVSWSLLSYLRSEFDEKKDISEVIVLVGSRSKTWCTTCKDYLLIRWPALAIPFLETFRSAQLIEGVTWKAFDFAGNAVSLGIDWGTDHGIIQEVEVTLRGTRVTSYLVKAFVDLIAWISSALRPTSGPGIYESKSQVTQLKRSFNIRLEPLSSSIDRHDLCWFPLFPRKVIAITDSIPDRNSRMKGLEISWILMLQLAGVEFPIEEESGIVLAGFRTVLKPIRMSRNRDQLQWHLEVSEDGTGPPFRVSPSGSVTDMRHPWLQAKSISELRRPSRHFIGWCPEALIMLGTRQDCSAVRRTQAQEQQEESRHKAFNAGLNLGWAGPGITMGRTYEIGRTEQNLYSDRDNNYRQCILRDSKIQILLYCFSRRQAWLVPKTSVLLHMVITSMAQMKGWDASLDFEFPYAEPSSQGGVAAYRILLEHRNDDLGIGEDNQPFLLQHLVKELWFALDKISRSDWKSGTRIFGYEFLDVIASAPPFSLKRDRPSIDLQGGWIRLLERVPVVLFYEGIPDPIRPSEWCRRELLCGKWRRMPPKQDYLAATVRSLEDLSRWYGHDLYQNSQITQRYFWRSPDGYPFDSCEERHRYNRECNRSQIITAKTESNNETELNRYTDGALVFRQGTLATHLPTVVMTVLGV